MSRSDVRDLDERGPSRYHPPHETAVALAAQLTDDDRFYWLHLRTLERAERAAPRAAEGRRKAGGHRAGRDVPGLRRPGATGHGRLRAPHPVRDALRPRCPVGPPRQRAGRRPGAPPECEPVLAAAIVERPPPPR